MIGATNITAVIGATNITAVIGATNITAVIGATNITAVIGATNITAVIGATNITAVIGATNITAVIGATIVRLTALPMLCTGVSSTCMLPAPPLDMRGSLLSGPIVSSLSGQWSLQMRRHKVGQFEHIPLHVLICHRAQHLDL